MGPDVKVIPINGELGLRKSLIQLNLGLTGESQKVPLDAIYESQFINSMTEYLLVQKVYFFTNFINKCVGN